MVSKLSGSVSSYRTEDVNKRYIHIEDVMDMFGLEWDEFLRVYGKETAFYVWQQGA